MSVSPSQNSAKPSPVPGPSTVASTPEQSSSFSPTAAEMGSTVEEPETFDVALDVGRAVLAGRACRRRRRCSSGVVVVAAGGGDQAEGEEQGQPGERLLLRARCEPSLGERRVTAR